MLLDVFSSIYAQILAGSQPTYLVFLIKAYPEKYTKPFIPLYPRSLIKLARNLLRIGFNIFLFTITETYIDIKLLQAFQHDSTYIVYTSIIFNIFILTAQFLIQQIVIDYLLCVVRPMNI
ncbi:hypothetical protein EAJ04_23295 [Bacteroides faecis]|nr:hypothetical protein EAJ04_23295 [Bacteroides faecis]